MKEQDKDLKKRAESKYKGFFSAQKISEKRTSFEDDLEEGTRLSHIQWSDRYNRWQFFGAGTQDLLKSWKSNPDITQNEIVKYFLEMLDIQTSQLKSWKALSYAQNDPSHVEHYNSILDQLTFLKENYLNGETLSIAIHTIQAPGYDHSTDPIVTIQKTDFIPNP